jgi:hypothetical protein
MQQGAPSGIAVGDWDAMRIQLRHPPERASVSPDRAWRISIGFNLRKEPFP